MFGRPNTQPSHSTVKATLANHNIHSQGLVPGEGYGGRNVDAAGQMNTLVGLAAGLGCLKYGLVPW